MLLDVLRKLQSLGIQALLVDHDGIVICPCGLEAEPEDLIIFNKAHRFIACDFCLEERCPACGDFLILTDPQSNLLNCPNCGAEYPEDQLGQILNSMIVEENKECS